MTSSGQEARKSPNKAAWRVIVLASVAHMLRSRRFYERIVLIVIALRALGQIGQENQAHTMERLSAWDKRQVQRLERKAKAEGRAIKGAAQMVRSDVSGRVASMKNGS